MQKKSLYTIFIGFSVTAYLWLFLERFFPAESTICVFKSVTGIPCPSCGTTRSIVSLFHGDLHGALFINPFGIVAAIFLLIFPLWITFDIVQRRDSFYRFYYRSEELLKGNRIIALFFVAIIASNWIWNIVKGL